MGTPASRAFGNSNLMASQPGTGIRATSNGPTPLTRPDLGYYIGFRQPLSSARRGSLAPSDSVALSEDLEGAADDTFIWGTNLSVARVQSRFNAFVRTFRERPTDPEPKYLCLLAETRARGEVSVNIDGAHLAAFDRTLYSWVISYPAETIPIFDGQLSAIAAEAEGADPESCEFQSRVYNLRDTRVIRDLSPTDINKLVSVSGMVTRTSGIIPDQALALFRCTKCGQEEVSWNDRGYVAEPAKCPSPACAAKFTMQMIYNRSHFMDKQLAKMQENPNDIPEGETPHTVSIFARQDLVDLAKPGDRVTVVGVYRAQGVRTNPFRRELKAVYKTYIDVVHVQKEEASQLFTVAGGETQNGTEGTEAGSLAADTTQGQDGTADAPATSNVTREEVEAKVASFRELAARSDVYDALSSSLAPSIWQLDDVKRGLLCQLFGGVSKALPGARTRGEINVLLVGDPGVSKSQLLGYVHKLAPRGIYTSGRGSSAVGLTAYVTKDPETREHVLESGALVLSDRGVCCIDEFDKMSEAARSTVGIHFLSR
jgi:DNA replication licensing factor MCM4